MFLGSWEPSFHSITRRIALPKKIRDYLATSEIVLSFGFDKCLFGFDLQSWEKEAARQIESPITQRDSRDIRRFLFSTATRIALDDQGRFVIPGSFLQYAQIERPVIIGAGDHFEIWNKDNWEKQFSKLKKQNK